MAHRPGYLGTTDHVRGEPGTKGRISAGTESRNTQPGSRTAEGGPPNQDPGDRAARKGRETDRRTPRRTRRGDRNSQTAGTPHYRRPRTGGNRVAGRG